MLFPSSGFKVDATGSFKTLIPIYMKLHTASHPDTSPNENLKFVVLNIRRSRAFVVMFNITVLWIMMLC